MRESSDILIRLRKLWSFEISEYFVVLTLSKDKFHTIPFLLHFFQVLVDCAMCTWRVADKRKMCHMLNTISKVFDVFIVSSFYVSNLFGLSSTRIVFVISMGMSHQLDVGRINEVDNY